MISLRNIHKSFNGHAVLRGVNLEIPRGKITVIIGPSGCGKTVLLRHIIGLIRPDAGCVVVDGVDIGQLNRVDLAAFRRRFGMLFQHAALFDSMSVAENVAFPMREQGTMSDETQIMSAVREKLSMVGLQHAEGKLPGELSGGMQKRAGLARAIALTPKIILYDEPTTGLDPIMTVTIDNLILSMQQSLSVTSVVISHDIESTLRVADQVAMLHEGRVIACAPPADFVRSTHQAVRDFLQAGQGARHKGSTA